MPQIAPIKFLINTKHKYSVAYANVERQSVVCTKTHSTIVWWWIEEETIVLRPDTGSSMNY